MSLPIRNLLITTVKRAYRPIVGHCTTFVPAFLSVGKDLTSVSSILNKPQIRWKSYKRFLDYSKVPTLSEDDLEEKFIRGSGPGGQATNKTNNAVMLRHKPSGIVVKCHETRSLITNRKRAREIMLTKLDNRINGEVSLESQERRLRQQDAMKTEKKRKKLAEKKKAFKEREGLT